MLFLLELDYFSVILILVQVIIFFFCLNNQNYFKFYLIKNIYILVNSNNTDSKCAPKI